MEDRIITEEEEEDTADSEQVVEVDETACLLSIRSSKSENVNFIRRHKRAGLSLSIVAIVAILIGIATYFIYFHGRVKRKVFAFNVWGMPGGLGGCKYKAERIEALAGLIKTRSPYFDIFLFEELWMEADHYKLQQAAESVGLYATGFRQLASR